jgi:hypothetical protein
MGEIEVTKGAPQGNRLTLLPGWSKCMDNKVVLYLKLFQGNRSLAVTACWQFSAERDRVSDAWRCTPQSTERCLR